MGSYHPGGPFTTLTPFEYYNALAIYLAPFGAVYDKEAQAHILVKPNLNDSISQVDIDFWGQ